MISTFTWHTRGIATVPKCFLQRPSFPYSHSREQSSATMSTTQNSIGSNAGLDQTAEPSQTSEKFCARDADVVFISSNNVLFHIHQKNLQIAAAGFPPAGFHASGEIVPLTEDATTLELLFQFVYPQRHPHLRGTPFDVLSPLAEAAEKYQVFAAMNICYVRMNEVLPEHAVEVSNYASRHGYKEILSAAAPSLLDIPLAEIVKALSAELVVPWVCYREAWSSAALKALSPLPSQDVKSNGTVYCTSCMATHALPNHPALFWLGLGEKRSRTALEGLFPDIPNSCHHLNPTPKYRLVLETELNKIPNFEAFI